MSPLTPYLPTDAGARGKQPLPDLPVSLREWKKAKAQILGVGNLAAFRQGPFRASCVPLQGARSDLLALRQSLAQKKIEESEEKLAALPAALRNMSTSSLLAVDACAGAYDTALRNFQSVQNDIAFRRSEFVSATKEPTASLGRARIKLSGFALLKNDAKNRECRENSERLDQKLQILLSARRNIERVLQAYEFGLNRYIVGIVMKANEAGCPSSIPLSTSTSVNVSY